MKPHRHLDGETVNLTLDVGRARHPLTLFLMYEDAAFCASWCLGRQVSM